MELHTQETEKSHKSLIEDVAAQSGLAVIVVSDEKSTVAAKANNNSICEVLYSSTGFAPHCAEFCGKAYENALAAGEAVSVQCHAGLHYNAVPLSVSEKKNLVAIVGRTFLNAEEYRAASDRAASGDWGQFSAGELFENVLLSGSQSEIDKATKRLTKMSGAEKQALIANTVQTTEVMESPETIQSEREYSKEITAENLSGEEKIETETVSESVKNVSETSDISKQIEDFHRNPQSGKLPEIVNEVPTEKELKEAEESAAWRSFFSSFLELEYKNVYPSILYFLSRHYGLNNLAWLERKNNHLESVWANGNLAGREIQIDISAEDLRLIDLIQKESSLEMRERQSDSSNASSHIVNLFPLAVGGEIRGGLLISDALDDKRIKRQLSRFIRTVSAELEVLRLREEVKRQNWTTDAVRKLNETFKKIDSEEFWTALTQTSAELMRAERSSLLVVDEETEDFTVKAAIGNRADIIKQESSEAIGRRVAHGVLESGSPLLVQDLNKAGVAAAPEEWRYKTDSFISYPIIIGGRKIGVLNITDKVGGERYDEADLKMLDILAPQLAVALDRTSLKRKAGEFEQLSITDALTGLLNRRYLEARLTEEINRSQRHGYPMSFMMIDVDEFKSYNDRFSHPEGDKALQIVGQCLKSTLRGADVAARYGGEEFSILLPQTNLTEAFTIAERIRQKVETTAFPNRKVTISIGIAACSPTLNSPAAVISAADKALYEAKRQGRNNVQIFQASPSSNDAAA